MIKLIVDQKYELDLSEDSQMSINYLILDITDFTKRATDFSQEFEVPSSRINDEFFESIFQLDKTTLVFNRKKRVSAIVTDGSNVIFKGIIQLLSTLSSTSDRKYKVRLIGTLKGLLKDTSDFYLSQLDLEEYNHTRDVDTIVKSWNYIIKKNGQDTYAREGYVYPYEIRREEENLEDEAYIYNLYPSAYIKTLWDKSFELAGYTYESKFLNSEFFSRLIMPFTKERIDLDETVAYERGAIRGFDGTSHNGAVTTRQNRGSSIWYYNTQLLLPYNLSYINLSAFNDTTSNVSHFGTDLQFRDSFNQTLGDIYTCQNEGEYRIDINFLMFPRWGTTGLLSGGSIKYENEGVAYVRWQVQLVRADGTVEVLQRNTPVTTANPWHLTEFTPSTDATIPLANLPFDDLATDLRIQYTGTRFLNPGDKIQMLVGFRHGNTKWQVVGGSQNDVTCQLYTRRNIGDDFTYFSVTPTQAGSFGNEEISLGDALPEWKVSDFLMEIIRMFNLVVEADKSDPVNPTNYFIEPYDDFFSGGKVVDDWEMDYERGVTKKVTDHIYSYRYEYDLDIDWLNKLYRDDTGNKTYGQYIQYTQDEFSTREETLKLKFASTPLSNFRIKDRIAPYYADYANEEFTQKRIKPRVLYYNGPVTCAPWQIKNNALTNASSQTVTQYPFAGMWDDPYNPTLTLEFGYSDYIYYNTQNGLSNAEQTTLPEQNLWNMFHQNSIRNRISDDYAVVEAYFWLSPKQIADFQFRDLVRVENQHYKVLEIKDYQYSNTKSLTKVVLERITNFEFWEPRQTVGEVPAACPTDTRLLRTRKRGWVLVSQSGAEISERCCLERGGIYKDGVCSIIPFVIGEPFPGTISPAGPVNPSNPPIVDPVTPTKATELNPIIIIDGGKDVVFPFSKENNYEVLDGTIDSVMNFGGIANKFIVDGNQNPRT